MKRYLIDASLEPSPAVTAALAAVDISVVDSPPAGDGDVPAHPMTLAVNAPSPEEAIDKVGDALRRWGEEMPVEVVHEDPL